MKAIEMKVGTAIAHEVAVKNCSAWGSEYIDRTGIVIANQSRQGDEVLIVEWDDDFTVSAMNVNDLEKV